MIATVRLPTLEPLFFHLNWESRVTYHLGLYRFHRCRAAAMLPVNHIKPLTSIILSPDSWPYGLLSGQLVSKAEIRLNLHPVPVKAIL